MIIAEKKDPVEPEIFMGTIELRTVAFEYAAES
jgi:hypothetical protein